MELPLYMKSFNPRLSLKDDKVVYACVLGEIKLTPAFPARLPSWPESPSLRYLKHARSAQPLLSPF